MSTGRIKCAFTNKIGQELTPGTPIHLNLIGGCGSDEDVTAGETMRTQWQLPVRWRGAGGRFKGDVIACLVHCNSLVVHHNKKEAISSQIN